MTYTHSLVKMTGATMGLGLCLASFWMPWGVRRTAAVESLALILTANVAIILFDRWWNVRSIWFDLSILAMLVALSRFIL